MLVSEHVPVNYSVSQTVNQSLTHGYAWKKQKHSFLNILIWVVLYETLHKTLKRFYYRTLWWVYQTIYKATEHCFASVHLKSWPHISYLIAVHQRTSNTTAFGQKERIHHQSLPMLICLKVCGKIWHRISYWFS